MKKFIKIVLSIILVFVLIGVGGIFYITRGLESGKSLVIKDVNPFSISDGTYSGKYSSGRWTNELNVTVKQGKITKIDVVKDVKFSKPEVTKELFDRIVKKQNTEVDIVSGATVTSKAYLKSIENALKK